MDVPHAPPAQPRQRRRAANRERILDAAGELVFGEGVDELSIKKVAEAADYTAGALYRYFPSKDALLAAVVVRAVDELREEVSARAKEGTPLLSVVAQSMACVDFARERASMFSLLTTLISDRRVLVADEKSAQTISAAMVQTLLPVAHSLGACVEAGELSPGDAQERALLLWSGLFGTLQLRKQERMAPTWVKTDALAMKMVRTLLMGWGAQDDVVQQAIFEASRRTS